MNTKIHHDFTLWVHDSYSEESKVAAIAFDEEASFDQILLTLLAIDDLGVVCSLTCETWSEHIKEDSEVFKND